MDLSNTLDKIGLYVLSLLVLFVFIIFLTVDVPLCLGERCDFVGFSALADIIWKNFSSILSLFGLVAGVYFYFRFENEVKGSSFGIVILKVVPNDTPYNILKFRITVDEICFEL